MPTDRPYNPGAEEGNGGVVGGLHGALRGGPAEPYQRQRIEDGPRKELDPRRESQTRPDAEADNWQHRAANMRCGSCMWFVPKQSSVNLNAGPIGRCRRHAPTMNGFPAVFATDWCGDHKLDENKL